MLFEVEIKARIQVSVETGGEDAARRVVRDRVCNDWLLRYDEGAAKDSGHYAVKGLSGEPARARPWVGNRKVAKGEDGDEGEE
jgi:hypothetical protein